MYRTNDRSKPGLQAAGLGRAGVLAGLPRHKSGGNAEPYGKYETVKIQDKIRENTKTKYKSLERARLARVSQSSH